MSTLYRPVLIETAEQAEALPEGSLVRDVRSGFDYRARHALGGYLQADLDAGVDVEALVPIEAEEEWALVYGGEDPTPCIDEVDAREWGRIDGEGQAPSHRLVTPWESV